MSVLATPRFYTIMVKLLNIMEDTNGGTTAPNKLMLIRKKQTVSKDFKIIKIEKIYMKAV